MSRRFLTPLNILHTATAPSSPVQGDMYFNTTDGALYTYDGSNWITGSGGGGSTNPASPTSAGIVYGSTSDGTTYSWTALGNGALASSVTTSHDAQNTAIGINSLTNAASAANTAVGYSAGSSLTSGTGNNLILGANAQPSSASASNEITFGDSGITRLRIPGLTLDTNDASTNQIPQWTGSGFTWIDPSTAATPTTAGVVYGFTDSGYTNFSIGYDSLVNSTSSANNTAVGVASMFSNTSGDGNTAIGYLSLYNNTTGGGNNAFGQGALQSNTTSSNNTAIGLSSLINSTGSNNTALGANTAATLTTGNNTIVIGNGADVSSSSASNEITLGNASITRFRIPGLTFDTASASAGQLALWTGSGFTWTPYIPSGGTAGQILSKIDATNYNTQWIDNYALKVNVSVKNSSGGTINAGQAVYVTGGAGTNILIGKAQANTQTASSRTLGLLAQTLTNNGIGYVTTNGLVSGFDTSAASVGDPVWLSPTTPGGLLFGASNAPAAPNHLVYIGVVTRSHAIQGEIYVAIVNGFELDELHNVSITTPLTGNILYYDGSTSLWKNGVISATAPITFNQSTLTIAANAASTSASGVVQLTDSTSSTSTTTAATPNSVKSAYDLANTANTTANLAAPKASPTFTGTITTPLTTAGYVTTTSGGVLGSVATIPNAGLTNSSITVNGTSFSLGDSKTIKASTTNALTIGTGLSGTSFDGSSAVTIANTGVLSVTGTTNQISASTTSGAVTLALPSAVTITGAMTAGSFVKSGGTSSQFLKADGSVDSNTYLTTGTAASTYLPLTGGTLSSDLVVSGNLTVSGVTTTINSTTLTVADKNIEIGKVGTPTDATANGGGILLYGTTNKTFEWFSSGGAWLSSEHIDLASGKVYRINGTEVLSATKVLGRTPGGSTSGDIVTIDASQTLTSKSISGSANTLTNIPNSALTNSSVTVGTTGISLGGSSTTLAGLTSVSSTSFTGALTGNADTATKLATARTINGTNFDGSANITITAVNPNALTIGTGLSGTSYDGSSAVTIANTGILSVTGTTNQITASTTSGATTLSLPSAVTITGAMTAGSFVKSGGTSSQFLKADGSVDSNTYLTTAVTSLAGTTNQIAVSGSTGSVTVSLPSAVTISGALTAGSFVKSGGTSSQFLKADGSIDSSAYITGSSPTITTPVIDTITASSSSATTSLYSTILTTGSINFGGNLTTGSINIGNGTSWTTGSSINIGSGALTTGARTITIGANATGGTTTITIGSSTGSTTNILGTAQVGGNSILTSTTGVTTVNGSSGAISNIAVTNADNNFTAQQRANSFIPTSSTTPVTGVYTAAAGVLSFATSTAEQARIDTNGDFWPITTATLTPTYIRYGDGTTTYASVKGNYLTATTGSLELQTLKSGTLTTALTLDTNSNALLAGQTAIGSTSLTLGNNGTANSTAQQFGVVSAAAGTVVEVIRAAASQTANLTEWQSSAGAILGKVSSAGKLTIIIDGGTA